MVCLVYIRTKWFSENSLPYFTLLTYFVIPYLKSQPTKKFLLTLDCLAQLKSPGNFSNSSYTIKQIILAHNPPVKKPKHRINIIILHTILSELLGKCLKLLFKSWTKVGVKGINVST